LNSFFCQQAKGNLEVVQQPIFLAAFGPVEFGLINTQIKLEVKVAPGAIPQTLIVQEIKALQATWVTSLTGLCLLQMIIFSAFRILIFSVF
jgi:hypothetical protein